MTIPKGYLLDTCVLVETLRPNPSMEVLTWMQSVDQESFYISSLSIGELIAGLERVTDPARRTDLMRWILTDLQSWFQGKILNVTPEVSAFWGGIAGKVPNGTPAVTSLQAALALKHGLQLVTRDTITVPSLQIVNPWGHV
jgi:predicted nucleic acid-binding protein